MRKFYRLIFLCFAGLVLFSLISLTNKDSVSGPANTEFTDFNVVPPAYANLPGTATFLGPFANSQRTYQLLIHANQITALKGSHLQAVTFRLTCFCNN